MKARKTILLNFSSLDTRDFVFVENNAVPSSLLKLSPFSLMILLQFGDVKTSVRGEVPPIRNSCGTDEVELIVVLQ